MSIFDNNEGTVAFWSKNSRTPIHHWKLHEGNGHFPSYTDVNSSATMIDSSMDIAIDKNGDTLVAYVSGSYIYVDKWNGSSWSNFATLVNDIDLDTAKIQMLIAPNGYIYIIYMINDGGSNLYLLVYNLSSWTSYLVESDIGYMYPHMDLDKKSGTPVIVYSYSGVKIARYAGGGFSYDQATTAYSAYGTSIVIDRFNRPRIAYGASNNSLRYIEYNGTSWEETQVDAPGTGSLYGHYNRICMDSGGKPVIAYYVQTNIIRIAWWAKENPDEWKIYDLGAIANVSYIQMAIDDDDVPMITFTNGTTSFRIASYNKFTDQFVITIPHSSESSSRFTLYSGRIPIIFDPHTKTTLIAMISNATTYD